MNMNTIIINQAQNVVALHNKIGQYPTEQYQTCDTLDEYHIDRWLHLHCWPKSCVTDQNLDLIHSHFKTDRVMSFIF